MGKGGSERVLSHLVPEMIKRGDQVSIYLLVNKKILYTLPNEVNVVYLRKYSNNFYNILYWFKSIRKIVKHSSVIISFAYKINIIVFFSSLGFVRKRHIYSERTHPMHDGRNFIEMLVCNYIYKRIDRLVVQNQSIKKSFHPKVQKNSTIISNPVNRVLDFKYKEDSEQIIAVGRLTYEKNFSLLIESFKLVVEQRPNFKLLIFGEGPMRDELGALIVRLDLSNNVKLLGITEDIFHELSESSIFVQTSLFEGQSNALLEAMVHGLPVVVTYYDGIDEIINDSENGWIIEPNPDSLATVLLNLISDKEIRINASFEAKKIAYFLSTSEVFHIWEQLIYY